MSTDYLLGLYSRQTFHDEKSDLTDDISRNNNHIS